jgi:uncharacterized paraquat-inducible protein A
MPDDHDIDADLFDDDGDRTIDCPHCGAEIDEDAEQCPVCGMWLTTAERVGRGPRPWLIVAVLIALILLLLLAGRGLF